MKKKEFVVSINEYSFLSLNSMQIDSHLQVSHKSFGGLRNCSDGFAKYSSNSIKHE